MRRISSSKPLLHDLALLRYDPRKTYVFYMPGVRISGFICAFAILGLPGVFFLFSYRGGIPGPDELLALVLLLVTVSGFAAQHFANRVLLGPDEIVIRKDHQDFKIRLWDIEDAFIAGSLDEVDAVSLPEGHYPMEFETHDHSIVVLVLRDGVASSSTAERLDGILCKTVSFNVAKPERFLAFLRMRT